MTYRFFNNCVGWDPGDVYSPGGLCDMIDTDRAITRQTFCRHIDRAELAEIEKNLGYGRGWLVMSRDFHVGYFKSTLHGKTVYGFRHSAIEYVFTN